MKTIINIYTAQPVQSQEPHFATVDAGITYAKQHFKGGVLGIYKLIYTIEQEKLPLKVTEIK